MSPGDSGDMRWDWNGEKGRTVPPTTIIETDSGHYPPRENDRAHIAAFSPSVCLRLIQEIQRQPNDERLRIALDEERSAHSRIATICFNAGASTSDGTSVSAVCNLADMVTSLREEIARLKEDK
jgi:hypothetical protein